MDLTILHRHIIEPDRSKLYDVHAELREIKAMLLSITKRETTMSQELDALIAQVHANSNLLDSATTTINGIAAKDDAAVAAAQAAGADPATLAELSALS